MAIPDQNYDMNDNNTNGSTEACKVESRGGGSLIAEVFPGFGTGVSWPPTTTALKSTTMKTPNGLTIKKKTKENVFSLARIFDSNKFLVQLRQLISRLFVQSTQRKNIP